MAGYCLAMDVGGSSIKYGRIGPDRELTEQGKVPTPLRDPEAYIDALAGVYEQFKGRVEGIALSVPGAIDSEKGVCITSGALELPRNFPLVELLEARCGVPVTVMNDAKAAAMAEAAWGALADCRDGAVIVLGTGISGALIKDGQVHMGCHYTAGEFSNIALDMDLDCPEHLWFGLNGTRRLVTSAAYARGVSPEGVNGEMVFAWINEGDEAVCRALDRFTATLALMARNLQLIFDPEKIAIGGGISRQPKLMESLQKNLDHLNRMSAPSGMPEPQVVTCKYFNDANLIGAYAYYARTRGQQ